ncbi:MAG TPA: TonB-dependent receptor, partial [Spongiibacteraceae bacterium]|nr:TonB-dependent receptor [Spongiibacteraceae bacterium]
LGDVTFKSLTGHRQTRAEDDLDWDSTPYQLLETGREIGYHATSQEFQMIGKTERVNYVGGLYYFKESGHTDNPLDLPFFPTEAAPGVFVPSPLIDSRYGLDNDARAVFAQIDWTPPILEDRLKLTAGGRYTRESKEIDRSFAIPAFGLTLFDGEKFDKDYSNFSPTGIISYQWTDALNTYAKVAKGWKAGVFNAESSDINELENPIKPEIVTSYELGMKSRWFDNRLEANLAYFYDEHKDMQISRFDQASAQSFLTNAGKAHIQGVELELVALPIDNLQISVSYGYIDAQYDKYMDTCRLTPTGQNPCPASVAPGATYDAKDVNKFSYTPENTANIGVQYTQPLPLGELVGRIDWSYTDDFAIYPDPYNYENTSIDSYQLVDVRLTWDKVPVQNANIAVSAWVKNLTDKQYRINGIEWGPFTTMNYGDPRTFGVDVAVKF